MTTKETVQVTTLEPKENDLSEEEDIQYGESSSVHMVRNLYSFQSVLIGGRFENDI